MSQHFDYGVVIPTRGRKNYLHSALESVAAQTIPASQVVVVVDGDVDGTVEHVRRHFPDVEVIEHPECLGPSSSRNVGLLSLRTEWVALLDDDDVWHSRKQEEFWGYLREHPDCAALRSAPWYFSDVGQGADLSGQRVEIQSSGERLDLECQALRCAPLNDFTYLDIEGRSLQKMLESNRGVTSSSVFRRDLLSKIPDVPPDLRTAQDWLLFVFVSTVCEWHLVPGRWVFYRVHPQQVTQTLGHGRWRYRLRAWELAWRDAGTPGGFYLRDYAPAYAREAHAWLWEEIRSGRWTEAWRLYRATAEVITDSWVRRSLLLPPPVRWRVRRWL